MTRLRHLLAQLAFVPVAIVLTAGYIAAVALHSWKTR